MLDEQNFDLFGRDGLFGSGALQFAGHERDQAKTVSSEYDNVSRQDI